MSDEQICYLPATELIRRYRTGSLSPVEVVEACLARADAVEPTINAFTHRFDEAALQQARAAERRYRRGQRTRKLEGLPIAVKDESLIKGMPCTSGSLLKKDYIADTTSIDSARILRAGGIVHARTATPEFSCAGYTHSRLHGVTRNPWNPAFTPGGSSGGAAAALAAGTTPLAPGSDIAGSIRIPASASGVLGYKPPYGRNAAEPPFNLDTYCHSGPLARNVGDLILLQNVLAGPHPQDIASLKPKLTLPTEYAPIRGWKIPWSMDLGFYEVDEDVRRNTLALLEQLRDLGAEVDEVDLRFPADMLDAARAHLNTIFGSYIDEPFREDPSQLTEYACDWARQAQASRGADFYRSLIVAGDMYNQFGPLFDRYQLFVCPTNATAAVAADFDQSRDRLTINGKPVDPVLGWFMTVPFNMMSRCPVISFPSGHSRDGVPTGVQLVGASYRDRDVFQAAMALETATGCWSRDNSLQPRL